MIPPEPEPEPPVPEPTYDYSYNTKSVMPVGPYNADVYTGIQDANGADCYVTAVVNNSSIDFHNLVIVDVTAFDQVNYYFYNIGRNLLIYSDNATIGGTHPVYAYDSTNGDIVEAGTAYVSSCTPSDYFEKIDSGNFVIEQRSTRGIIDESDLDNY